MSSKSLEYSPWPWSCENKECKTKYIDDHRLIRKCAGCRRAYFCSQECQRAMWPAHRDQCRRLQQTPNARKILPSYPAFNNAIEKLSKYLFGEEPATERIQWFRLAGPIESGDEPHVIRGKNFVQELIPRIHEVHAYSIEKFISTRCRGAVILDFSRPVPIVAGKYHFAWITERAAWRTKDMRLIDLVANYDPAESAPIFLYTIGPQERFIHLAGFQSICPPDFMPRDVSLRVEEVKQIAWAPTVSIIPAEDFVPDSNPDTFTI